jgi:hypothetical protein
MGLSYLARRMGCKAYDLLSVLNAKRNGIHVGKPHVELNYLLYVEKILVLKLFDAYFL